MGQPPRISVIIPAHNPHPGRLRRTLDGLAAQTLAPDAWELLLVDNGSIPHIPAPGPAFASGRVVVEPTLGLTPARLRGLSETRGDIVVFVDDDNVLSPRFLESVRKIFSELPRLGAAGGPVTPEFEQPPPAWASEFLGLLALRDLGPAPQIAAGSATAPWPAFAPVGAGLCLRRAAAEPYILALRTDPSRIGFDRTGRSLASGGDNDLVFTALHAGWDVGYFPELALHHLIPSTRVSADYLARLNQGIMRTWVRVLHQHAQSPWPAIARWTLPMRTARAWWRFQPWRSPAHRIRWRGAVGQFQGQADIASPSIVKSSPATA